MKSLQYILSCATLSLAASAFQPVMAQVKLADDAAYPVIVAPHKQTASYRERTLCYDIDANVDYTVTSQADWISVRKADNGTVYVHIASNPLSYTRTGKVVFANEEKGLSETLVITQTKDESMEDLPTDETVKPTSATVNNNQSGYGIERTYDNNLSTFWHTTWASGSPLFVVSEDNPAILTYTFNNASHIDYINYVSRTDGNDNGNFGNVEVYAKCGSETDYTLITTSNCGKTSGEHRINLGADGLDNVKSIQIKVLSGEGNYASCAEMQFCIATPTSYDAVFADQAFTTLKEGTTQEQINAIEESFLRNLADSLYHNTYDTAYRVADYKAKLSYVTQSTLWNAPGKYYDQRQGVTGINISKGKHAIAVSGLAEGSSVPLIVTAWYVGKDGNNFDGGNPQSYTFSLQNGLNIIDYTCDYDGLAYVCYYADANPELQPTVKVHFINGQVNGYLSPDKTNEEMHELTGKAPNKCMDVVGTKVHSVWQAKEGLHLYCKATDGTSIGYRQYMNVLDSLIAWEHDLLGFAKYDRLPDNRTMAYTNYTYYMFQGGFGVSFHHNQEYRVLNCKTIVYNDNDAIWGLSHEWGHQHQMHPYFCWAGMSEVTNNMNSYYNIMKMGYYTSDKINNWTPARKHFVQYNYTDLQMSTGDDQYGSGTNEKGNLNSHIRWLAYNNREKMSNTALRAILNASTDSVVKQYNVDPAHALSINEMNVGEILCPFVMLYNYFAFYPDKAEDKRPDFAKDWYEALRQTDNVNGGSTIEKTGGFDKYELIAAAQNGNKNGLYTELAKQYPNSCWVKNGYITANSTQWENSVPYVMNYIRKVSRLTGYNLLPYFERWGFLRQVCLYIGDYGNKWMIMNKAMYDEFEEDMNALGLKECDNTMITKISNTRDLNVSASDKTFPTPEFPN